MTAMRRFSRDALIGASALVLAACNTVSNRTVATPQGEGHVIFESAAFTETVPTRIGWINTWQEEEYTRFSSKSAQAEIIYSVADERDSVVLDFDMTLDRVIGTWHTASSLGEKGNAETPLGTFQYQHFTQTGQPCVGFLNEWDYRQGDRQLRPAKVLFGYYCGKFGSKFGRKDVANLLSDIWIRDINRTDFRFTPRLSLASGAQPSTVGNLRFPYARADRFVDADGERLN